MADWITSGKVRMTPRGTYSSSTSYNILDIVKSTDGTKCYIAKKDVPAGTDLTDTEYYELMTDISELSDEVSDLKNAIIETEDAAYVTNMEDYTMIGLTFNKLADNQVSIYGTQNQTGARQVIILNGKKNAKTTSGSFEQVFEKGSYIFNASVSGPLSSIPYFVGTYSTFADNFKIYFGEIYTFEYPAMVSIQVNKNAYFGTSSDPTIITFDIQKVKATGVKTVSNDVEGLRNTISNLTKSVTSYIYPLYSTQDDVERQGITYTNQGSSILINGESTGLSFYNFCDVPIDEIGGVGKNVVLSYQSSDDKVLMDVWALASPENYSIGRYFGSGENLISIPDDNTITALRFRFTVYEGTKITNASVVMHGLYELPEEKQESYLIATRQLDINSIIGVTIQRVNENTLSVYGQATTTRAVFCCNGNEVVNTTSMPVPLDLKAGTYVMYFETTHNDLNFRTYIKGGTTEHSSVVIENGVPFTMDVDFGVGLYIKKDTDYGTEQNPSIISFYLVPSYNAIINNNNNIIYPTGNQEDRTSDIQYVLNKYGSCVLSGGDYYVSGIHMPNRTTISGQGAGSKIILLPDDGSEMVSAILMGSECTVHDLTIEGSANDITLVRDDDIADDGEYSGIVGNRHGILWTTNSEIAHGIVHDLQINHFTGGGITCLRTGTGIRTGLRISNINLYNNKCGIYIANRSEFHNICNVNASRNFYGIIVNGGNNFIANSSLSGNVLGLFIGNGTDYDDSNGMHGAITNCNIHHNNDNVGIALYLKGTGSGYVFNGVYFGHLHIRMNGNVNGTHFIGCVFTHGVSSAPMILESSNTSSGRVMFDDCQFWVSPTQDWNGNIKVKSRGCYLRSDFSEVNLDHNLT